MSTTTADASEEEAAIKAYKARTFLEGVPEIPEEMVNVLTQYSKIPKEKLVAHVQDLRNRAWAVYTYPCIGRYRFLTFPLLYHPLFKTHVLSILLANPNDESPSAPLFLDIGTCLGQDLRLLVHSGVPTSRIYATDIKPEFIDLGYQLFLDEDRFPRSHQIAPVDIFDTSPSNPLDQHFKSKVSVLHIAAVFHLFNLEDNYFIARRLLHLMRPQPGSLILGWQTAHRQGKAYSNTRQSSRSNTTYKHNNETWKAMWDKVAEEEGFKIRIESELDREQVRIKAVGAAEEANGPERERDPNSTGITWQVWFE